MPRRRDQTSRRKSQSTRGGKSPNPWDDLLATGRTAGRALAVFKGAANLLNAEIKSSDTTLSSAVSASGSVNLVSGVAQGDGVANRDGNSLKLKGGSLRWFSTIHASASRTFMRVMVVADTRCNGSTASLSDILNALTVDSQPDLVSEPNRYVILSDVVRVLCSTGEQAVVGEVALPQLMDMHLTFSGTGATVASISGPAIYVIALSNESTNTPQFHAEARLLYVDN